MPEKFPLSSSKGPASSPPSWMVTPLSARGWPTWLVYLLAVIGVIYLLNPTAGFLEFLPDNLPIIGNLDEGAAFLLIYAGLLEFFEGRRYRQNPPDSQGDK